MAKKKQLKKEELKKRMEIEQNLEIDNSTRNIIINAIVIILVFISFYFLTTLFVNRSPKFNTKEETVVEIQYEEILAGEIFNKSGEYYVLFYDFSSNNKQYYDAVIENSNKKVYKVDINKGFNKPYIAETSNPNSTSLSDMKVSGTTLIRIKDSKIDLYIEGELEKIKENL